MHLNFFIFIGTLNGSIYILMVMRIIANRMYTRVSNVQIRMLNKFPRASTTMAVARGRLVTGVTLVGEPNQSRSHVLTTLDASAFGTTL